MLQMMIKSTGYLQLVHLARDTPKQTSYTVGNPYHKLQAVTRFSSLTLYQRLMLLRIAFI